MVRRGAATPPSRMARPRETGEGDGLPRPSIASSRAASHTETRLIIHSLAEAAAGAVAELSGSEARPPPEWDTVSERETAGAAGPWAASPTRLSLHSDDFVERWPTPPAAGSKRGYRHLPSSQPAGASPPLYSPRSMASPVCLVLGDETSSVARASVP